MPTSTGIVSASVKSLYLSDFQSHSETKIDLAPEGGLTVIVGPTDSGKTAIVRALRLLYYNTPSGFEFVRVGRDKATVAVEMGDGTKVARERSQGSINRYRIVKQGGQPQMFEGFGLGVPLEVQEVTGVRTVSIGDSLDLVLNLSEQLDGPFLGNKTVSGPARAKILGSLAGTEEVDKAHSDLGTDLLHATQNAARLEEEIGNLQTRIDEYDYLGDLADKIEALSTILDDVKAKQARLVSLEACADGFIHIGGERGYQFAILSKWRGLSRAISHVEYAEDQLHMEQALSHHHTSLAYIAAQRQEQSAKLARWVRLGVAEAAYLSAQNAWARHTTLYRLCTEYAVTCEGAGKARATIYRWQGLLEAQAAASVASDLLTKRNGAIDLRHRLTLLNGNKRFEVQKLAKFAGVEAAAKIADEVLPPLFHRSGTVLARYRADLIAIRQSRVVAEQALSQQSAALADAQSLYADTLISLGTCPVCGSKVDPESLSQHIKEVA